MAFHIHEDLGETFELSGGEPMARMPQQAARIIESSEKFAAVLTLRVGAHGRRT